MNAKEIGKYIPLKRAIRLLILLSISFQFIVLSQMYFFRMDIFNEPVMLLFRLLRGVLLTFLAGAILVYPIAYFILYLNRKAPWKARPWKRLIFQFPIAVVASILVTPLIIIPAGLLFGLEADAQTIVNNAYYLVMLTLFLMVILEARIYFEESALSKQESEKLQQDLLKEVAAKAMVEAQIMVEEEKNRAAQKLISQEKRLNESLSEEIRKRELVTLELQENREQLNSILINLAGAAFRCFLDDHYTMKYISEKIFEISGYHASEFIGNKSLTYASIIHPEDQADCRKKIEEAILEKRHYEFEYRIVNHKGETVWVNENGKGIYNPEGHLEYLDGIITDITRRKEAELAAKESDLKYKELMDFLPQPVFELNLKGDVVYGNKAGYEFFGPQPDDPDQRISALDCFIKEDVPRIIENFNKSAQGVLTDPGEFTAIKRDGTLCPVMVFGTPIIRNEKIVGRRGIIVDISERKKQELKLIKAKEELERINNTLEQRVAERTKELTEANTQLLKVQKENLQSQFEVLKQQVNPHFLFNSLNVLTSLIKHDPDLAESFTERLSKVYRYVLENKEKDLVTLKTELEFLNAYLFLLEIRFMKKLFVEINIDKKFLEYQILPIAIQLLIENAIKHNTFSKAQPLKIEIFVDENLHLNIINNLNERETKLVSTGVGLENIKRRYALVSEQKPEFIKIKGQFIAKLPLLNFEESEIA